MKNALITLLILTCVGCQQQPTTVSIAIDEGGAKKKASAAFKALGGKLKGELLTAIGEGGPVGAVEVCKTRAPAIAAEISEAEGFSLGRSSHRVRNSANTPNDAVAAYLEKYREKKAEEVPVEATLESGKWTVIAPIATQPLCLTCHGDPKSFEPALKEALASHYPDDTAVGFEVGDLRGVFWATIPEQPSSLPSAPSDRKIKTH